MPEPGDVARASLLTPRMVAGVFVVILVLAVLLTPDDQQAGDENLTTRSTAPRAAQGLAETLGRLGWTVRRRATPYAGTAATPIDTTVVHAVLAPLTNPRPAEVSALLDAVRRGASLLLVVERRSAFSDSLVVTNSFAGGRLVPDARDTAHCGPRSRFLGSNAGVVTWPDGMVHTYWLTPWTRTDSAALERREPPLPPVAGSVDFERARITDGERRGLIVPAARGWALGRGRLVVVADPDLLRNDVLRVCRWGAGVAAVRMAEWLAASPGMRRTIEFDEFHQGVRDEPAPGRVVARALAFTRGGHAVLQLAVAALVLLAASSVRALAPAPRPRVARRSPLEHVDALARAYAQVGATRLVARRLVRGLRRRHGRLVSRAAHAAGDDGDATFLRGVAQRHPPVAGDVERLLHATERAVPADELPAIATAAAAVDRALTPHAPPP